MTFRNSLVFQVSRLKTTWLDQLHFLTVFVNLVGIAAMNPKSDSSLWPQAISVEVNTHFTTIPKKHSAILQPNISPKGSLTGWKLPPYTLSCITLTGSLSGPSDHESHEIALEVYSKPGQATVKAKQLKTLVVSRLRTDMTHIYKPTCHNLMKERWRIINVIILNRIHYVYKRMKTFIRIFIRMYDQSTVWRLLAKAQLTFKLLIKTWLNKHVFRWFKVCLPFIKYISIQLTITGDE